MRTGLPACQVSCTIFAICLVGPWTCAGTGLESAQPAKIDLRVLYAGHPGSEREADVVRFLGEHLASVKTCDLKGLRDEDTQGVDVTILDYDGDGFKAPQPSVTQSMDRPIMTLGVAGGFLCDRLLLKTGYL